MPFPCLSRYILTWASPLCYVCLEIVDTCTPPKLGSCASRNQEAQTLVFLMALPTELWTVCRALCPPSSTAETPSVFLLMHAMSQWPSDIHNTFVIRAEGPRPSFLLHSSTLVFHSPPLLLQHLGQQMLGSPPVFAVSVPDAKLEDTAFLCNLVPVPVHINHLLKPFNWVC